MFLNVLELKINSPVYFPNSKATGSNLQHRLRPQNREKRILWPMLRVRLEAVPLLVDDVGSDYSGSWPFFIVAVGDDSRKNLW